MRGAGVSSWGKAMNDKYLPVARPYKITFWAKRPNSERVVNPVIECNRLFRRIDELEATIRRVRARRDQLAKASMDTEKPAFDVTVAEGLKIVVEWLDEALAGDKK